MITTNFISLYQESFREHWSAPALTNYEGITYTYADLARGIARWHLVFERMGLKRGEKVALMGQDTAEWVIVFLFLSTITYGCVIVPVLQDFSPVDAAQIIRHSEARLLFVSDRVWQVLSEQELRGVDAVINVQTGAPLRSSQVIDAEGLFRNLEEVFVARYPKGFERADVEYYPTPNSNVMLLNYTSGTTGFSKGVMITGRNMAGNVLWCRDKHIVRAGMRLLSFLPLAHAYGCMINVLLAMTMGVHVTLLGRAPSAATLGTALRSVRPHVVITVPLLLEKIYQSTLVPLLRQRWMKLLLGTPVLRGIIHKRIRSRLLEGMGGSVTLVIAGGAPLHAEVGAFLKEVGFPLSVGYGMTECAPLISFTPEASAWRLGSSGQVLDGYMQARIVPVDDESGTPIAQVDAESGLPLGEIQVRGENVCLGYYKEEGLTKRLFTEDGWLRTGDLGVIDEDNFIYIKGRSKTMLLGANGQNIYPEEIEAKLSMLPYVLESLVVMRENKLVALIVLDQVRIQQAGISEDEAWAVVTSQRSVLNEQLGSYEKIQRFELQSEPFAKTPKQSIKRYMYS